MNDSCSQEKFSDELTNFVLVFEGLLSASVVSTFSLTEPKKNPLEIIYAKKQRKRLWAKKLAYIYLMAWLVTGLSAFVVGVLIYPKINPTLNAFGANWIALALSSVGVYLGLKPQGSSR